MFYVYILESKLNKSYYVGSCKNFSKSRMLDSFMGR
ncbi:GIY-YIG nuclease family protein [Patescibacteria group bacterium]